MNLVLKFRSVLQGFSATLVSEFDQLITAINTWSRKEHHADGSHGAITVTSVTFYGTTQTTVGAAGSASALPATPSGYLTITIGTTEYVSPFYAKS